MSVIKRVYIDTSYELFTLPLHLHALRYCRLYTSTAVTTPQFIWIFFWQKVWFTLHRSRHKNCKCVCVVACTSCLYNVMYSQAKPQFDQICFVKRKVSCNAMKSSGGWPDHIPLSAEQPMYFARERERGVWNSRQAIVLLSSYKEKVTQSLPIFLQLHSESACCTDWVMLWVMGWNHLVVLCPKSKVRLGLRWWLSNATEARDWINSELRCMFKRNLSPISIARYGWTFFRHFVWTEIVGFFKNLSNFFKETVKDFQKLLHKTSAMMNECMEGFGRWIH